MKVRVDTDGTNIVTIHAGETLPTGTVLGGSVEITEGDLAINSDTSARYIFNGTSWQELS